ncbi:tripartite tricarboxylate transporter substrate binding protein [Paracoccus liaowanqingii]|uniref:Tripartite tricarboxylate transporter substrate binding protein n=1 Tax=Paracoccus liaowanqingii TaxID=2560053 RepID=A0A4P7HR64_9RHOB|nr:tripartite tricarboxylate transporter substrate-binding protein [Paracoccus liaowanqingii]QBX35947.1 tripartite tricarboxylate transporter substrate binding protein [Paracoccus liaowanqingii]TGN62359.1 tripartite tricarboxylate transporter substrate binding protein [Paracoccus liaowanqingii]
MKKLGIAAVLSATLMAPAAMAELSELRIMAPAGPGGGWDQTARSIQSTLQAEGLVSNIQVENVAGAGGTIGLQQFVNRSSGDPAATIVGGYVMVGAVIANDSPVSLTDVTPLARLTGEYVVVVAGADSPINNAEDLAAALAEDAGSVTWAGGSAGGVDHIAAGLFAQAADVDPATINYIPYSGGGEALAAILGGQVTVGVSGFSEFSAQIEAGSVKVIGITAPERQDYLDAPTFAEQGYDVEVQNWRMIAGAPGITDEQKAELVGTIETMAGSEAWAEVLASRGWVDTFLAGDEFTDYLNGEIEATAAILTELGITE